MSKLPTKKLISDFKIAAFVFRVGTTFTGIFCFCFLLNICETFEALCPSGLILNKFSGKCLKLHQNQLSWQNAREMCKSNDGDLIRITDSKMNRFVYDLITNHSPPFWIGLSKKGDQFYWLDENRNATYVNWHSSTRSQETSVCAAMGSNGGKWVDMICDGHHKFVCEIGEGVCSPGWIPSFPSGSCIKMSSTRKTWNNSRKACKVDGGDLVKIADEAMNDFIWEQMSWLKGNTHWIGANDLKVPSRYVWLDESEKLYFTAWGAGQPNFPTQHCVDINHPVFNKGWTDYWCNQTALFICEKIAVCLEGTYGKRCDNECSRNCAESRTCSATTGECTHGCVSGYQPKKCDSECEPLRYGPNCVKECSPNCAGNGSCNASTGICTDGGCVPGYQGGKCDEECEPLRYGPNCVKECSPNCAGSGACNASTGNCTDGGCEPGYQGGKCDEECEPLRYGPNCLKECSPNCAGSGACTASTGKCTDGGCEPGYQGGKCDEVVQVGKLEAGGGAVFPIALAGLCLIPLACLVLLFVRRRRKKESEAEVGGPNKSTSVASFKGDIKVQENVPVEENADTTKDTEVAVGPNLSVVFNGPTTGSTTSGAAGLVEDSLLQQPSKLSLGRVHSLAPIKSTILPSESSNQ